MLMQWSSFGTKPATAESEKRAKTGCVLQFTYAEQVKEAGVCKMAERVSQMTLAD